MKTKTKTEIVIPTWAGRTGPSYWGDQDYPGYDNQSTSFWVSFRGLQSGDQFSYMNDACRAMSDIGLHVYVSVDSTVSIDLRLHDTSSLTLVESVQRIKALKRLFVKGKAYRFSAFARDTTIHDELTKAIDALGIALKRISDCIDDRLHRMKQRQVA
jgi:hypothetical protein